MEIGDNSFRSVETFVIDGMHKLKTLRIGKKSFTESKNGAGSNYFKSFHIKNCESLESIDIGPMSFSDYAGEFELNNLPLLRTINFGEDGSYSVNFYNASFVIRGNILLNIKSLDLPSLESISLGPECFRNSLTTILESIV